MSEISGKVCDQCGKISYLDEDRKFWISIDVVIDDMGEETLIRFNNRIIRLNNDKDFCSKDCLIKFITGEPNVSPS
jgi:hypothetical protein